MSEFYRGLSHSDNDTRFVDKLGEEANKNSWWADVLADPELFVAVRDCYLNVYWRGHSLFRVEPRASGIRATTHPKFLLDPDLSEQVPLVEGTFEAKGGGFLRHYEGPETLKKMKRAADLFSEPEKTGCHEIVLANPQVTDCEIAFPGSGKGTPRVDLLSLEPEGDAVRLVFWEAKHFTNGDLRALGEVVPVREQMQRYRQYLCDHRERIEYSYQREVRDLVAIEKMRRKPRRPPPSPLITEAALGKTLTLGAMPKVGLVIFGFDKAQRDDRNWRHHLDRLKREIAPLVVRGDAKGLKLRL